MSVKNNENITKNQELETTELETVKEEVLEDKLEEEKPQEENKPSKQDDTEKPSLGKRIIKIVLNVLFYLFFLLALVMLIMVIASKRDREGVVTVFNHELLVVISPSMEKNENVDASKYKIGSIKTDSIVNVELAPLKPDRPEKEEDLNNPEYQKAYQEWKEWYDSLEVGDVLTFKKYELSKQTTITHRLVEKIALGNDGYKLIMHGDNNDPDSNEVIADTSDDASFDYVVGKVVGTSHAAGWILTNLKKPAGIVIIVILPSAAIAIYEIIKIVNILNSEKAKDVRNKNKEQIDEIERLKQELERLKNASNNNESKDSEE